MVDPRFKYFRNEKNLGIAGNWRKALYEYATGEWVLLLNDDDYLIDNWYISKAISLTKKYKSVVLVHANYVVRNENSEMLRNSNLSIEETNLNIEEFIKGKYYFIHYGEKIAPPIGPPLTSVFDRLKAVKVGAFTEDIPALDMDLWLRLMLLGDIAFVKDHVAVYRDHGKNETFSVYINKDLENIENVFDIYHLATKLDFTQKDLKKWTIRQVEIIFMWRFFSYFKSKKQKDAWNLFKQAYKKHPYIITKIFFKPKNLVILILNRNKKLFVIAKKIKRLLRRKG